MLYFIKRRAHHVSCRFSILALICCLLDQGTALAQSDRPGSIGWFQRNTIVVTVNNARQLIEPTLSPTDRETAQSINYVVTGSYGIGAFAAYDNDQRVIVIHAGTIQMMDWFYDAITADADLGHKGCYQEFVNYLQGVIARNNNLVSNHMAPDPAMTPSAILPALDRPMQRYKTDRYSRDPWIWRRQGKGADRGVDYVSFICMNSVITSSAIHLGAGRRIPVAWQ